MKSLRLNCLYSVFFLLVFFPIKILAQWNQPQWVVDKYEPLKVKFKNVNDALSYRLLRPINFDASKKYPVVITLHGYTGFNKATANDYNINNLRHINQEFAKDSIRLAHPSYIVCLQGIKNADNTVDMWDNGYLNSAKDIISSLPNVDMNKIYVLGQSAGGFGTNKFISLDPAYFAAAIVVSTEGANDLVQADRDQLVNFNLWTMHGDADTTMKYAPDVELFDYMKSINAKMKFTTFLGVGHSTEYHLVNSYEASGKAKVLIPDTTTGIVTVKNIDYTTQFAGTSSDPEPNTLDWLFSKSLTGPMGVKGMNKDRLELNVYPNPTHSVINWNDSSNINEIVLIDVNGKMVLRVAKPSTNSINLSSLKKGVYFIKFRQDTMERTKKIVKK
ncbi:T9SS type A sorting domain-containing protein [Flavobacterium luteum]|uniref:T9SS type A sorting domain-containing protein n=1 Tax=Flavobacterium luteum TaxID=2026654 RepID=A0A7J5A8X0_9FLAO|nr:T9SS type A sorting domain-containing protein [Flavobacterium luteum]KAB1154016.1 T9SS type A sorting domain-containing protein [Flavobacterium luteum]